jgi:DNA-binding Xre family transcriptional regulator
MSDATPNPLSETTAEQIQAAAELEELCKQLDVSADEMAALLRRS